jgi:WD40 repeat protein
MVSKALVIKLLVGVVACCASIGNWPGGAQEDPREVLRVQDGYDNRLLAISPDGTSILCRRCPAHGAIVADRDKQSAFQCFLVDTQSGKVTHELLGPAYKPAAMAAFSDHSKLVAVGYSDNSATIWDLEAKRPLFRLTNVSASHAIRLVRTPAGTLLIGWRASDSELVAWELPEGQPRKFVDYTRFGKPGEMAFSTDGLHVAIEMLMYGEVTDIDFDQRQVRIRASVHVWEVATGRYVGPVGKTREELIVTARGRILTGRQSSLVRSAGADSRGFRMRLLPSQELALFPSLRRFPQPGYAVKSQKLVLTEMTSGKQLWSSDAFKGGGPDRVAVSDDNCFLAASGMLTKNGGSYVTIVWDIRKLGSTIPAPANVLSDDKGTMFWNQLAEEDASSGHAAATALIHARATALQLIEKHLVTSQSKVESAGAARQASWCLALLEAFADQESQRVLAQLAEKHTSAWLRAEAKVALNRLKQK